MERILIKDMPEEFCSEFCAAYHPEATIWPKCGYSIFNGPYCGWTIDDMAEALKNSNIKKKDIDKVWCRVIKAKIKGY